MPREGLGLLVVVIAKAVGVSLGVFLVHGSHFELGAEDCDLFACRREEGAEEGASS